MYEQEECSENEERPANIEKLANKEPTNEEIKDTFILLEEKILKIKELLNLDVTIFKMI
ncbi:9578_t:CDS:2 [Cetraspora pellucida]|uniref:9578_t:CDS:1 n=1 Tax=Cetraspora pellucida TaxID=1433469 RepID=A0ACA9LKI4_9GLOM|nr:9578_t:CDS:2 [Cetraspora pellucida]